MLVLFAKRSESCFFTAKSTSESVAISCGCQSKSVVSWLCDSQTGLLATGFRVLDFLVLSSLAMEWTSSNFKFSCSSVKRSPRGSFAVELSLGFSCKMSFLRSVNSCSCRFLRCDSNDDNGGSVSQVWTSPTVRSCALQQCFSSCGS